MNKLVLVGVVAHAQARIALDVARASGLALAGYLDVVSETEPPDRTLPRLGDQSRLDDPSFIRTYDLFIAAAEPERRQLARLIQARAGRVTKLIHPSSIIAPTAVVGDGTLISAACVVGIDAQIGRFCTLHSACTVDHDDVLGDWVTVAPGAHLEGWVKCGEGAYIGIGAVVIGRIHIGVRAVVGAGAVVIRDVPPATTVAGNPAKAMTPKSSS